jgi:hypothetical protein
MPPLKRTFDEPDEKFKAGRSTVSVVNLGGVIHKRIVFGVGWHWAEDVMPEVEEKLCSMLHVFVHISGKLRVKMLNGNEYEYGPGDISVIQPGHDAWVVGNEPVIVIDHTPTGATGVQKK